MWRVTVLSAAINVVGSKRETKEGWSPGSMARLSETKNRSSFPRSAVRAMEESTAALALLVVAPW